jgi:hypothetical protein
VIVVDADVLCDTVLLRHELIRRIRAGKIPSVEIGQYVMMLRDPSPKEDHRVAVGWSLEECYEKLGTTFDDYMLGDRVVVRYPLRQDQATGADDPQRAVVKIKNPRARSPQPGQSMSTAGAAITADRSPSISGAGREERRTRQEEAKEGSTKRHGRRSR